MKAHSGFTLVELMITVAILAIVAAIAIPAYNGYLETARSAEGMNNIASLRLAEEEYFLEHSTYIAGTYNAVSTTYTLAATANLSWTPAEANADQQFSYSVALAGGGYTITASSLGRGVSAAVVLSWP